MSLKYLFLLHREGVFPQPDITSGYPGPSLATYNLPMKLKLHQCTHPMGKLRVTHNLQKNITHLQL